jgi:hypothetical protein
MLNFDLGPYFGYALSNTNIGGIYFWKHMKKPLQWRLAISFSKLRGKSILYKA